MTSRDLTVGSGQPRGVATRVRVLRDAGALEWAAIIGVILALEAISIPENFAVYADVARWKTLLLLVTDACVRIAFAPLLFWWFDALPLEVGVRWRNAVLRTASVVALAGIQAVGLVFAIGGVASLLGFPADTYGGPNFPRGVTYAEALGAMMGLSLAYTWVRRLLGRRRADLSTAQLETDLMRARLDALSRELRPHFLFNTLNGIAELVGEDPDRAEAMVIRLSDLLRATMDGGDGGIALETELERLDLYMQLQQMRSEDRIKFEMHINDDTLGALVPAMLLQPLIENSIVHGVDRGTGSGTISVHAERGENRVTICVVDDGVGLDNARVEGIGLSNTRARIEGLFGDEARLDLASGEGGGTEVRIDLPFRACAPDAPFARDQEAARARANR